MNRNPNMLESNTLRGTVTVRRDGIVETCDDAAAALLGGDAGDIIDRSIIEVFPDQFAEAIESGLRQLNETGDSWLIGQRLSVPSSGSNGVQPEFEIEFARDDESGELSCSVCNRTESDRDFQQALLATQHELSPDGIIIVSPQGEILFYNDRYAEIWDISTDVLEFGSIHDVREITSARVVDPEGVFQEGFQRYDKSRKIARDEFTVKDGRVLVRHSAPVLTRDNTLLGRFWSYRDVTEQRRTQQRLKELTERLSTLVDNNADIVAALEADGTIVSLNHALVEVLGYQPEELVGYPALSLFEPDQHEQLRDHMREAIRGSSQLCEVTARHRDGNPVELRLKLIPVSHCSADFSYWVVATDITAEKQALASVEKARTSLETAQRIARIGSFEWNLATDALEWSDGTYEIFGVTPDAFEATFDNLREFVHPDDRETLVDAVYHTLKTNEPYEMDLRIIRADGMPRVLHAVGEAIFDERGSAIGMIGTTADITDRKREEEALQHLVSMLAEKSEALEIKTREQEAFIYSVSHDLRSPLISIQGMAEILAADYAQSLDGTAKQYLERILVNGRRLQDMLSGLLELSRIGRTEKGSRQRVDLQTVVSDIIADLRDSERGKVAEIIIENELPHVHANYSRMVQLFTNLLDNAIKYTPKERTPRIAVSSSREDGAWQISISDNGIGMAAEQQRTATGMFARLPQGQRLNPSGSGLGLAIVNRIVETHGGTIEFESVEGEGTRITFTLS